MKNLKQGPRLYAIIEKDYRPRYVYRIGPRLELHSCKTVCKCKRLLCVPFFVSPDVGKNTRLRCIYILTTKNGDYKSIADNLRWNTFFTKNTENINKLFIALEQYSSFGMWPISDRFVYHSMRGYSMFSLFALTNIPKLIQYMSAEQIEQKLQYIQERKAQFGGAYPIENTLRKRLLYIQLFGDHKINRLGR